MGIYKIHTNIPLDFPTLWTGSIYRESNIDELFKSDEFVEKIVRQELCGTVGFKKLRKIPSSLVSHVVVDAYISESKEILFNIKTLDNKQGYKLDALLTENPMGYLAKMIAMIDVDKSLNGVQHLVDITYVHIDKNDYLGNYKITRKKD